MSFAYAHGNDVREESQGASQIINLVTIKPWFFDLVFRKPNSFFLLESDYNFQLGLTNHHNFSEIRESTDCSKMSVVFPKPRSFTRFANT